MAQQNDQVFQLSLTEIAFTITFLLLLLLGYLVFKEQTERLAAEAKLEKVQRIEQATAALDSAKSQLAAQLQGAGIENPDEVISKLIAAEEARMERDQLRQRIDDLDAQLTALTELKNQLEQATASVRPELMQDQILSALAMQEQVRNAVEQSQEALSSSQGATTSGVDASQAASAQQGGESASAPVNSAMSDKEALTVVREALSSTSNLKRQLKDKLDKDLSAGNQNQIIDELVSAAKGYSDMVQAGLNPDAMKKENSDLRGQVAFLKNRLDARGGRDHPPCWADEKTGKVEYLFSIEVSNNAVAVSPAKWTTRRATEAKELPGIEAVLAGPHSNEAFVNKIQGIFNWSKAQNPECRHYVELRNTISDGAQSDRARRMVENFFYKFEVPR